MYLFCQHQLSTKPRMKELQGVDHTLLTNLTRDVKLNLQEESYVIYYDGGHLYLIWH